MASAGGACDRVAVRRAAVAARHPPLVERSQRAERSEGKPRGDALRHADDVGLDAQRLDREHLARPPEAALGLVGDEQDAVLFTTQRKPLHEPLRRRDVPALADHGLDHERRNLLGGDLGRHDPVETAQRATHLTLLVGGVGIGERCDEHAAGERPVAGPVDHPTARHGERVVGAAVEGAVERDDVATIGGVLRELDGRFDDLITGAAEVEGVDPLRRDLGQLRRQRLELVVTVDVDLRVDDPTGLLGDRRGHLRMGVARRRGAEPRGEVEVLVAVDVDDAAAGPTLDLEIGRRRPDAREMCSDFGHPTSLCRT